MANTHDASDVLAIYTRDIAKHPVLSREEEKAVGARALQGDEEAQQELVRANLRFVIRVAQRYQRQGVPLMDLIQAGNIGLNHAARRFDPSMDNRFISYAVHWIRQAIQKEIDETKGTIRPTKTQMVRVRRVRRLQAEALQRLGRKLTIAELIKETGFTRARIKEALEYRPSIQSLDSPLDPAAGSNSARLMDVIGCDGGRKEREAEAALSQATDRVLHQVLSTREREIIEEYFGFGDRRELSLTEIGMARGISRERARQLKERALRKLRAAVDTHPFLLEHFALARPPESSTSKDGTGETNDSTSDNASPRRRQKMEAGMVGAVLQGELWADPSHDKADH